MRSLRRTVIALCAAAFGLALLPATATAATPPQNTAPLRGERTGTGYPTLRNVRWAAHDGYDRIVFDFSGGTPGYDIRYGTLTGEGTGTPIALAGSADLVVRFSTARAHTDDYTPTYRLRTLDPGLTSLKQVKFGGDFEGYVSAGLGLREVAGFRVSILSGPPRVVIDVGHKGSWLKTTTSLVGTATTVATTGVRAAKHTTYDRVVWDLNGTRLPSVTVRYLPDSATIEVVVKAVGATPAASYGGPSSATYGYPAVKSVKHMGTGSGRSTFRVSTAARHGFRITTLGSPVRVVLDVAR